MHREFIVLPPEKKAEYFSGKENHSTYAKEFIKESNINIEINEDTPSYKISYALAELGYSTLHIDNKMIICFLPKELSEMQYNWFIKNKKGIVNFEIHIGNINEKGVMEFIEDKSKGKQIKHLYKLVKQKRLINDDKKLVKKWK